jgi:hypothetical protein
MKQFDIEMTKGTIANADLIPPPSFSQLGFAGSWEGEVSCLVVLACCFWRGGSYM